MGQILSLPITEKHSENVKDERFAYGLSCMQGWRIQMEDAHATILNLYESQNKTEDFDEEDNRFARKEDDDILLTQDGVPRDQVAFFGVYDGHGGEKAAIYTGKHLHNIIRCTDAFKKGDYINAFKEGYLSCDQAILSSPSMRDDDSGCAATSVIVSPKHIICGNAGDSRSIMSINGYAKALSYDHKPSNEGEKARICSAGGYVDMGRVNGNLALSRGIGDFEFKKNVNLPAEEQIVTCYPDVIQHETDLSKDEFLVLACDGIWDCLTSQKCVECVRRGIFERKDLEKICEDIMELCCAPTSDGSGIGCDNMSIVIVALLDHANNETLEQWYEKIIKRIEIAQEDDKQFKYGPISAPYDDIYKEMYGSGYEIGRQSQGSKGKGNGSGFGFDDSQNDDADDIPQDNGDITAGNGAISLQKLLASNAITNENGVIYLDTSSAQSLLAHFGMAEEGAGEEDAEDNHIEAEEVEDEDEEDASKE